MPNSILQAPPWFHLFLLLFHHQRDHIHKPTHLAVEAVDVGHGVEPRDQHALLVGAHCDVDPAVCRCRCGVRGLLWHGDDNGVVAGRASRPHCTGASSKDSPPPLLVTPRSQQRGRTHTLSKRKARPPRPVNCLEMIWSLLERCVLQAEQTQTSGPSRQLSGWGGQTATCVGGEARIDASVRVTRRRTHRLKSRPILDPLTPVLAAAAAKMSLVVGYTHAAKRREGLERLD